MTEPKPIASLSGLLLARKGAARPAMRPQVQRLAVEHAQEQSHLEDLGWDDMGEPDVHTVRAGEVLALTPAPVSPEAKEEAEADDRAAAAQLAKNARLLAAEPLPEVLRQQDLLTQAVNAPKESDEEPPKKGARDNKETVLHIVKPRPAPSRDKGRRAAFTLRLDDKRHLKLRLLSTIEGRSAQQLVTKALDRMLDEMPELELLAAQVQRRGTDFTN